VMCAV